MAEPRKHSDDSRARISHGLQRYHERRRQAARVAPRDLQRLRNSGTVSLALRPLLRIAEDEAAGLIGDLGGADAVTEARRVLVEMAVGVGMIHRAELTRFLQSGDLEAGSRATSAANSVRATLTALGLDRRARDVPTLATYLKDKSEAPQGAPGSTNGADPVSEVSVEGEAS